MTALGSPAAGWEGEARPAAGEQLDIYAIPDARKERGMAAAEASTDEWWHSCAETAVRQIAATGEEFQSYDLVLRYGLPEPAHKNQWGPLLPGFSKGDDPLIVAVGFAKSKRPETNSSIVRTWRGAQSASAFDQALDRLSEPTPARRGAA